MRRRDCLICSLVLLLCAGTSGFLLEGKCPVAPPCECVYNTIACSSRNLSAIPTLNPAGEHYNTIAVTLNFNNLDQIPANAFSGLGATGAASIEIKMASNQISRVDPDGFSGIEHAVTYLDLTDNKLDTLPSAVGKLSALKTLAISRNPLTSLPVQIIAAVGNTLGTLSVSLDLFNTWPTEMDSLTALRSLDINGFGASDIPDDAFLGFNDTLQTLKLQRTRLTNIPSAVCFLRNAKTFEFSSNYYINTQKGGDPCRGYGSLPQSVTTLTLSDDDLRGVPDLFSVFPSTTRLSLSDNNISLIYDSSGFDGNHVTEVDLKNNSFDAVPHVLNRFKELTVLRLDYNSIAMIGADDLSGMPSLRLLYLTHNPITSIDPAAFTNNAQITILDLSDTQLSSVPVAVTSLPHLVILHLSGVPVECSCGNMAPLKNWDVTSARFKIGTCAKSSDYIVNFIRNDLPKC